GELDPASSVTSIRQFTAKIRPCIVCCVELVRVTFGQAWDHPSVDATRNGSNTEQNLGGFILLFSQKARVYAQHPENCTLLRGGKAEPDEHSQRMGISDRLGVPPQSRSREPIRAGLRPKWHLGTVLPPRRRVLRD